MKKMAISGSTGLIAGSIMSGLDSFSFIPLTRSDFAGSSNDLYEKIKEADIVINLAGAPIIKRWSRKNIEEIYNSRIETTGKLVEAIKSTDHDVHLISASAIGIYDSVNIHDEASCNFSEGFVKRLVEDWETEALKVESEIHKVTLLRIGLVMSGKGGMINKLLPLFKIGLGGAIGKGNQLMSFIHTDDMVRATDFLIRNKIYGVVNMTTPAPVSNMEFTKTFGSLLKRPAFLKVPVFVLKLFYGRGAETLLAGQNVTPGVLLNNGFDFRYPDINSTLKNIIESA